MCAVSHSGLYRDFGERSPFSTGRFAAEGSFAWVRIVCEQERSRECVCERERDCVCVCVCVRDGERASVCVCVYEGESVCVCERERERDLNDVTEGVILHHRIL